MIINRQIKKIEPKKIPINRRPPYIPSSPSIFFLLSLLFIVFAVLYSICYKRTSATYYRIVKKMG